MWGEIRIYDSNLIYYWISPKYQVLDKNEMTYFLHTFLYKDTYRKEFIRVLFQNWFLNLCKEWRLKKYYFENSLHQYIYNMIRHFLFKLKIKNNKNKKNLEFSNKFVVFRIIIKNKSQETIKFWIFYINSKNYFFNDFEICEKDTILTKLFPIQLLFIITKMNYKISKTIFYVY